MLQKWLVPGRKISHTEGHNLHIFLHLICQDVVSIKLCMRTDEVPGSNLSWTVTNPNFTNFLNVPNKTPRHCLQVDHSSLPFTFISLEEGIVLNLAMKPNDQRQKYKSHPMAAIPKQAYRHPSGWTLDKAACSGRKSTQTSSFHPGSFIQ